MGVEHPRRFGNYKKVLEKINSSSDDYKKEAKLMLWSLFEKLSIKIPAIKKENGHMHTPQKLCPLFFKYFQKEENVCLNLVFRTTDYGRERVILKFPAQFNESNGKQN